LITLYFLYLSFVTYNNAVCATRISSPVHFFASNRAKLADTFNKTRKPIPLKEFQFDPGGVHMQPTYYGWNTCPIYLHGSYFQKEYVRRVMERALNSWIMKMLRIWSGTMT